MESLDWLARNPRYTTRYALHVGALCRKMTVKDVARSERLPHSTVKELDKLYRAEQPFNYPQLSAPILKPNSISVRRDNPLHITMLPGGGSLVRAR